METNDIPVEDFIAPTDSQFEAQLRLRREQHQTQKHSIAMTAWLQDHEKTELVKPEQFTIGRLFTKGLAIKGRSFSYDKDTFYGPSNRFPVLASQEGLGSVSPTVAPTSYVSLKQIPRVGEPTIKVE